MRAGNLIKLTANPVRRWLTNLAGIAPRGVVLLLAALSVSGCSLRQVVVNGLADELSEQAQSAEEDPELARDASAFYLKLSESLLQKNPGHLGLAEAVAAGFTQYSYAFVSFDADRLESTDATSAQRLRERAARMYWRAQRHALAGLVADDPDFLAALASPAPQAWPRLRREQIGLAYWASAAWGGAISLSKDDPEAVADLPLAMRLARLSWELDPDYGDGALASLMGTFEAARPDGSSERARDYFDRGIALAAGKRAGAFVAKAEGYAQPAGDRELFESLLDQAQAVRNDAKSSLALQNEVMRRRAEWLRSHADELF